MAEKKKILYIITKGNFGGAQRYVYDLATNLPKNEFEAVVACGGEGLLIERLKEAKVRTIEIEGLGRDIEAGKDFKALKKIIKIIKEEKPDIVHLNSSKIGVLGSLAILYLRTLNLISFLTRISYLEPRSVFTAHGWAFNERNRPAWQRAVFYVGHYLTALICDQTIAVSEKAKRDADFPFIQDKISVIYNGLAPFKPLHKAEAKSFFGADKRTVIFSTSELHVNKGLDVAIKAISLLPKEARKKVHYFIAGGGEESSRLVRLIDELGLEAEIKLLGYVEDARRMLSGADLFLLPSRTEAFPYSLLEAGYAGLPVIASCVGGIPEVIKDMQSGILVHPRNSKEIAEAILYILDHPQKAKEFGSEIKKTVQNFFSLEKMISETIALYSKL